MRHRNMTFSIPENLKESLRKQQELDAAYQAANHDPSRLEILRDWETLDDVSDLIGDEENWDWLRTLRNG